MAASNAHFWVGNSWDSSEEMMIRSRRFCTHIPRRSYIDPLSASAAKTVIVTLQGAQAIYEVVGSISRIYSQYAAVLNLGNIFLPIAIFGLLRLPAAPWISEDLAYANEDMMLVRTMSYKQDESKSEDLKLLEATLLAPPMRLPLEPEDDLATTRFRPTDGIHGIAVRAFYLIALLALTGFTAYSIIPSRSTGPTTTFQDISVTNFTHIFFFLFFLLATSSIFIYYCLRGNTTTTIIPCLNSTWYKVYTALLSLGMLALVILATIETRKSWCGLYTTYPSSFDSGNICPRSMELQASVLEWGPNNSTTDFITNFNGIIAGSWLPGPT
jgi:hypothetical protein